MTESEISQIPSPCYVLEESLLRRNLAVIDDVARRADVTIIPALKGFALWAVFPVIRPFVKGVSASSPNEARLAWEEMRVAAHSYAPVYTEADMEQILRFSSHITFNSLEQYRRHHEQVLRNARPVSMGLRVNPEISQVSTDLYNPCARGSRLGMTCAQLGSILPANIEGLHIHALCESSAEATAELIEATCSKFGHFFNQLRWINFGGGHLMTRRGYNIELLVRTLCSFRSKYPHITVILEPGSAFAWETGFLKATVEDITVNGGINTAILNVSFTAHMPDCLEMPYKPRILGASDPQPGKKAWRLGGNSCLAGDFMGDWSFDEEPTIGKSVIFEDMIHYTMVKTTFFNGVRHPSIGIWRDSSGFSLIKQFGYDDYKNRLS